MPKVTYYATHEISKVFLSILSAKSYCCLQSEFNKVCAAMQRLSRGSWEENEEEAAFLLGSSIEPK